MDFHRRGLPLIGRAEGLACPANVIGSVVASLATTVVFEAYPIPLPAPQPSAMAAVLWGVMGSRGGAGRTVPC